MVGSKKSNEIQKVYEDITKSTGIDICRMKAQQ
jgi:hypothetical protein